MNSQKQETRYSLENNMRKAWADHYWSKRKAEEKAIRVGHILRMREIRSMIRNMQYSEEVNERGCVVHRFRTEIKQKLGFLAYGADSYGAKFDVHEEWEPLETNQDAPYFGIWINVEERMVFTFCEGDETLCIAPDDHTFYREVADAVLFYASGDELLIPSKLAGWKRFMLVLENEISRRRNAATN